MYKNIRWKKSKAYLFINSILYFTSNIFLTQTLTNAKPKDVTNSISNKQDIKELVQIFITPYGYHLSELMKKDRTKIFDFSKASDRRNILNLCYEEIYNKVINDYTLSTRIFGKPTSNIDMLIGDWGISGQKIKVKKFYKTAYSKYKFIADINWIDTFNHTSKKIGIMRLYLERDTNSYYGYIAKSMRLRKLRNI